MNKIIIYDMLTFIISIVKRKYEKLFIDFIFNFYFYNTN